MRRTAAGCLILSGLAALMTGCAAPHVDEAAAEAWLSDVRTDSLSHPEQLADVSGKTHPLGTEESIETFSFDSPLQSVDALRVGCFGAAGETATASWTVRTGSSWYGGGGAEIACDGTIVTVGALADTHSAVNAVMVRVARDGERRTFFAALDGQPAESPE